MNRQEAKEILLHLRSGIGQPADEEREALQFAEHDPELRDWFQKQQTFQAEFQRGLRQIQPPAELKARILAGRKIVRPAWRRRSFIVAAAAAVIMMAIGLVFWGRTSSDNQTFALFQSRMVGFALRQYRMDIETPDERRVREYLAEQGRPAQFPLPQGLAAMPVKGGASLTWKGEPVSMLCFDWQGTDTLYLFVIEESHLNESNVTQAANIAPYKGVTTAAWRAGEMVYLLVGRPEPNTLRGLL